MTTPTDDDFHPTPFVGDRTGSSRDLGELPIDGDQVRDSQLMSDADLREASIQGDRFDPGNDDLGHAPDLEDDPDAPDLRPDSVGRFAEADVDGEPDPDDVDDRLTARPSDVRPVDERVSDPEPGELEAPA